MFKRARTIKTLFRYLNDPEVSGWSKFAVFLPLLYLISPVDIFPDVIFPFGYLEDFGVLFFGWQMIRRELDKYVAGKEVKKGEKKDKDNVINLKKDEYKIK